MQIILKLRLHTGQHCLRNPITSLKLLTKQYWYVIGYIFLLQVVHCKISDSLNGAQSYATFPQNLRGKFQKVDEQPLTFHAQDLFRENLPIEVILTKPDPSIGFDPLTMKETFLICKTVTGDFVRLCLFVCSFFELNCDLYSITSASKGRVPLRSAGPVEQSIKLLSGLT